MNRPSLAVAILAGGRSARLGRDKAQVRLAGRTLLAHARTLARALGVPVRVVRRDLVPRCGPLGGIYTALKTCEAEAVLFLAVDMPFVSVGWLKELVKELQEGPPSPARRAPSPLNASSGSAGILPATSPLSTRRQDAGAPGFMERVPAREFRRAIFTAVNGLAGFPFVLRAEALPVVEQQIAHGKFSLQALARALRATTVEAGARAAELVNINTAGELDSARRRAATFRPKAPEDWRSPKAGAGSKRR